MGSLIAIGGSKGSGKDTVVNYLEAKLQNRSYSIMKFASPLNRWLYSEYRVHPTMLNVSGIDKDTEMTNVCWTGIPVDMYHKYYHQCFDSVRLTYIFLRKIFRDKSSTRLILPYKRVTRNRLNKV